MWTCLLFSVCFVDLKDLEGLPIRASFPTRFLFNKMLLIDFLKGSGQAGSRSPLITFQDAIRHFQTASYLEQHMSHIKPTVKHRGMAAVTHKLFGPPQMNSSLHLERNLIFALALCMFKNDETMHNQVLQTIYKKLTGTKLDCPRYGNHWELIGFQGVIVFLWIYVNELTLHALTSVCKFSVLKVTSLSRVLRIKEMITI